MKDSRIVPFVAYAFASGDEKLVDKAFTVSFKMAQLDGFTSKWYKKIYFPQKMFLDKNLHILLYFI